MCKSILHSVFTFTVTADSKRKTFVPNAIFDTCQRSLLEEMFNNNSYPNKATIKQVACRTGLPVRSIRHWLERRRREIRHGRVKNPPSTSELTFGKRRIFHWELIFVSRHLHKTKPTENLHTWRISNSNYNNIGILLPTKLDPLKFLTHKLFWLQMFVCLRYMYLHT